MTTLVLGVGSPFGDDQVGWLLAEKLQYDARLSQQIKRGELVIVIVDRPGLNLLSYLQQNYNKIILIDMVKTKQNQLGTIFCLKADEIARFSGMLSSHSLGISSSLALAQALSISIDNISFWGIEGRIVTPEAIIPTLEMMTAINLACEQIIESGL